MDMKNTVLVSLPRRSLSLVVCMAIITAASLNSAQAQDWNFEPIIKFGGEYNDNGSLSIRTDEEVKLEGILVDMRADINYLSDATTFFLQPRALVRNYPDEPDFDSDDLFLRSRFVHRGKSSSFGFRVNFDQQSLRTAERTDSDLEIDDPGEIPADDTGRVGLEGDRTKWRLSPYWNYRLSGKSVIGVTFDYVDARYEQIFANLLEDYTDSRIGLNYRRSFSPTTTGLLTLASRRFDPIGASNEVTGNSVLAGFERVLSEKMRLVAMIGVEDSTNATTDQSQSEPIGNITLTRDLETISMFAQYDRAITANGSSNVEVRDNVNMNFERRLNERISAGLGVRAYHSVPIGSSSSDGRNYVQLQAQFTWYLSKAFVAQVDYRYSVLDRSSSIGERSNSNQVLIWLVYQPRTIPKL